MAITLVQWDDGYPGSSLAYPSPPTAGNLLIVTAEWSNALVGTGWPVLAPTLSDTNGNTWYVAGNAISDESWINQYKSEMRMWYAWNCKGGASTVSFTPPVGMGDNGLQVFEYSGIDINTDPLDQSSSFAPTSTDAIETSITTTSPGLVFAAYGCERGGGDVTSIASPFTVIHNGSGHHDYQSDVRSAAAGTHTSTYTITTDSIKANSVMVLAGFRAAVEVGGLQLWPTYNEIIIDSL